MANFVNLTPHGITLRYPDGSSRVIPPSGSVARVNMTEECGDLVDGMTSISRKAEGVEIPDTGSPDGVLLVSSMVSDAAIAKRHPWLARLAAPDTGATAVRENGQVVAVTRLVTAAKQA